MVYFGVEIFDGKPLKEINIDENIPLEYQWFHLTQDILCIDYSMHEIMNFSVDVGWYPSAEVTPNSYFKTIILEGPFTDGAVFYEKKSTTIQSMKSDLTEAIGFIQSFKQMSIEDIIKKKIANSL